MQGLLYEIKIPSRQVPLRQLWTTRELHYLSDLMRLLTSKRTEQDDGICCVSWRSAFRCAEPGRRGRQEGGSLVSAHGWASIPGKRRLPFPWLWLQSWEH